METKIEARIRRLRQEAMDRRRLAIVKGESGRLYSDPQAWLDEALAFDLAADFLTRLSEEEEVEA